MTDANVVLGRLNDLALLGGRMPIDPTLARAAVGRLASELRLDLEETTLGIIRVACTTMVKAIRSISVERGHDPAEFALFVYGGAGPIHAVDVARELEIGTIIVPPSPGILCADGALTSPLRNDFVRTLLGRLDEDGVAAANAAREQLIVDADAWFEAERIPDEHRSCEWAAELRYVGQNYEIQVPWGGQRFGLDSIATLTGGRLPRRARAALRLRLLGRDGPVRDPHGQGNRRPALAAVPRLAPRPEAVPAGERETVFERGGTRSSPVYRRGDLAPGQIVEGPAIVEQLDTTLVLFPGDRMATDPWGNLVITLG